MSVDSRAVRPDHYLKKEDANITLTALLSAPQPSLTVVNDKYARYPWTPEGGSLVEQRFATIDWRRMKTVWTNIRSYYGPLLAVPKQTDTDFPFLRGAEDWRVCQVLRHLAHSAPPRAEEESPYFAWEFYPGPPPALGEMDRGFFVPEALGERSVRTTMGILALYEQREVRDVPVTRRKELYPNTPHWWPEVEVPRGMAARIPVLVGLRGSQLIDETLGGPYHAMLATLWVVEVADVFVGSIRHHGHLWRLPLALRTACLRLTTARMCAAQPSVQPVLEAGLELLRIIEVQAQPSWLESDGTPRSVFRCSRSVDDMGRLTLLEGLGDARLPYGKGVHHDLRIRSLDRDIQNKGSGQLGSTVAATPHEGSAESSAASSMAPQPLRGAVARPMHAPRGGGRYTRARRVSGYGAEAAPLFWHHAGPPLTPLPLFSWMPGAQLPAPRAVCPAVLLGLEHSLGELPPTFRSGMDHTLIMALSRTCVRLRNEVAAIVSRPIGPREAEALYDMSTAKALRGVLAAEYGTAVSETNTVMASWSLRQMAEQATPASAISPAATHGRPPPAPLPQYGSGSGSQSNPFGSAYYSSGAGPSRGPAQGYGSRHGSW